MVWGGRHWERRQIDPYRMKRGARPGSSAEEFLKERRVERKNGRPLYIMGGRNIKAEKKSRKGDFLSTRGHEGGYVVSKVRERGGLGKKKGVIVIKESPNSRNQCMSLKDRNIAVRKGRGGGAAGQNGGGGAWNNVKIRRPKERKGI